MEDIKKLTGEVVNLRSDVLYLIRIVERLEAQVTKLTAEINDPKKQTDAMLGKIIEKL
jgi:hypothetical protein